MVAVDDVVGARCSATGPQPDSRQSGTRRRGAPVAPPAAPRTRQARAGDSGAGVVAGLGWLARRPAGPPAAATENRATPARPSAAPAVPPAGAEAADAAVTGAALIREATRERGGAPVAAQGASGGAGRGRASRRQRQGRAIATRAGGGRGSDR